MTLRLLAWLCLAASPVFAAEPDFSADRVKAHVGFFADDLLEGRGTGTRGHEIAARYAAATMAGFGLKPAAKDGSWLQPVTLSETRLGGGPARLTILPARGGAPVSYANGTEVLIAPSQVDAVTDVDAAIVFAGFGIDAPAQGFDDYAGLDVRGKIVVVLSGIPNGPASEIRAQLSTQKSAMAAAHGAIGLIQMPTFENARLHPWQRSAQSAQVPRMTWVRPDERPSSGHRKFVRAPG